MKNIEFTREGKRFLIALALIGLAAANTGNNLIYLILSMMLSIFLISFLVSILNLRSLDCIPVFREPLYAGTPFKAGFKFKNSRKFSSYSVGVVLPQLIDEKIYFPVIEKGTSVKTLDNLVIGRRGRYRFRDFKLKTGFPFIFIYLTKRIRYDKVLIVYPTIGDINPFLRYLLPQMSGSGSVSRDKEGDFLSPREYVYGEESRHIDWKATAKTQKTMVKEFSRSDEKLGTIILDNSSVTDSESFEKAVSAAATICLYLINNGYYVRLITCGKIIPFGRERDHLLKIMDILAVVSIVDFEKCPIEEQMKGIILLIKSSDKPGFADILSICTGVIDARHL